MQRVRCLDTGEKLFLTFFDKGSAEADGLLGRCRVGLVLKLGQDSLQVGAKDGEDPTARWVFQCLVKDLRKSLHLWVWKWT